MSVFFNNQRINLQQQDARIRQHGRRIGEKDKRSNEGNLLVFGYACNLYYDENKAVYFDEGKHLIPWMGDDSLMIDRYDGRLLLEDLSQFVSRGLPGESQLSEDELEIERQCDQERYLALEESSTDTEYEEEEMKRFKEAIASEGCYSAVGFSYNQYYPQYNYNYESTQENPASTTQYFPYPEEQTLEPVTEEPEQSSSAQDVHVKEEEIEVFVPPEELGVPDTMEVPDTAKLHVIIERTAFFIKDHGPQMEIVVKAKQSGNQQFDFLQFDHRLNPYYKLILKAVRSGTYEPASSKPPAPPPSEEDDDSEDSDGDFELHPLLTASLRAPIVSTKKQKPTIPYSEQPLPPGWTVVTTEAWEPSHSSETGTDLSFPTIDGVSMAMPYPLGYHFQSHSQINPFPPPPPPPGESPPRIVDPETHPLFDMHHPSHFPAGMPVDMYPGNPHGRGASFPGVDNANYMVNVALPIIPPPPDLKPICDKLAEYAARNGRQFEENIRAKGDPRFDFLNQTSDHYTYYQMKRKEFEQNPSKSSNTSTIGEPSKSSPLVPSNKPVSFQIKVKDAKRNVIEYRSSVLFKTAKADESEEEEEETNEEASRDDQSKDSSQNGESAVSQPEVQGPKTQEDVMAEERTTKLKEEKEKEVQRLEEEAKSTTSSLRRQVQLERRRRAQLFINMLKKTTPSSEPSASNQGNDDPN